MDHFTGRRNWAWIGITVLATGSVPVAPATIPVGGGCTLDRAIDAANDDDTAAGRCPPGGSGADVLQLGRDVRLTSVDNTAYDEANGLPVVTSDITIAGGGFTVYRAPTVPGFRIFAVGATGNLTLQDLTVSNGLSPEFGGGIVSYGTLRLENSQLVGNRARIGGGIGSAGPLILVNSSISGNEADFGGGIFSDGILWMEGGEVADNVGCGILNSAYDDGDDGYLSNVSIRGNTASGINNLGRLTIRGGEVADNGRFGVVHDDYGVPNALLEDVTVSGNARGGVSVGFRSSLILRRCTIAENRATGVTVTESGGVAITNSTISGNTGGYGGGIDLYRGAGASVRQSTIVGNRATGAGGGIDGSAEYAAATVQDSIVAHNLPEDCNGIPSSSRSFGTCPGAAPITPGVDFDTTLRDNGGSTRTHALLPGSVAIDASGACGLDTDQRGVPRNDGACDAGAFEFVTPVACTLCGRGDLLVGLLSELRVDGGCNRSTCRPLPPELDPVELLCTLPEPDPGDGYFYLG